MNATTDDLSYLTKPEEGDTNGRLAAKKSRVTFNKTAMRPFFVVFEHAAMLDINFIKICNAGCQYCFAVANKKAVKDTVGVMEDPFPAVQKKIQKAHSPAYDPTDFVEMIIHNRWPMVFSNNVEPFLPASEAKYRFGERMLKTALEYKQVLRIQSKEVFTPNVRDLIVAGKDHFNVYVSVTTLDDKIADKYETGCIPPSERLRRIEYLTSRGVEVVVGMNPYVPEWHHGQEYSLKEFFKKVKESGATGIYTDALHFTPKQRETWKGDILKYPERYAQFYDAEIPLFESLCKDVGLQLYYERKMPDFFNKGFTSKFQTNPFTPNKLYNHLYKIWEKERTPLVFGWKFVDKFYSRIPQWSQVIRMSTIESCMANSTAGHRTIAAGLGAKNKMSNIFRFMFNNPEDTPTWMRTFGMVVVEEDEESLTYLQDEDGDNYYVFDPDSEYLEDTLIFDQEVFDNYTEVE